MSRKYRSVLASILTAAIILGNTTAVNAAGGNGQGKGSLDIVQSPEVFNVVLPTNAGNQFNYILDPTGVIAQTGGDKYASSSFVPGKTMYFRHEPATGNGIANYDDVSDPIIIYNRSNVDVEIKIRAKLEGANGVTIAASRVADDPSTDPKIYMALTEGSASTEKAITAQGIEAAVILPSAKQYYKTVYDANSDTYKNEMDSAVANEPEDQYGKYFAFYYFMLTGDCNKGGNWSGFKGTPPTISLVWTVDKLEGAASGVPSLPDIPATPSTPDPPATPSGPDRPSMAVSDDGIIWINGLTSELNYANEVTFTYDGKTTENLDSDVLSIKWRGVGTTWDSAKGGTLGIELRQKMLNQVKGKSVTVTVKLTDGSTITVIHTF